MLSSGRARQLLDYDAVTGVFTWRDGRGVAGSHTSHGYVRISIDGRSYRAHRLAWLIVFGFAPNGQIDHINGRRDDNRISNLRIATQSQNNMNSARRNDNSSGVKGVGWFKPIGKWQAYINRDGRRHHLGYFNNFDRAVAARRAAEAAVHGEFRRKQ